MTKRHPKEYFRVRAKALLALTRGEENKTIASVLQVEGQTIRAWVRGWNERGLVGILNARKGGAPAKLTQELIELAVEIATREPMSLAQIAERLRQERSEAPHFSLDRLGIRLRERGMSYKRTRHSLKKRDPDHFKRFQAALNHAKQLATTQDITLLFVDERGFAILPDVQRSWSPRGQPHCADAGDVRKRINVLGGLNYQTGRLNYDLHTGSIRQQEVENFLQRLAEQLPPNHFTLVILDNARIHHAVSEDKLDAWLKLA